MVTDFTDRGVKYGLLRLCVLGANFWKSASKIVYILLFSFGCI